MAISGITNGTTKGFCYTARGVFANLEALMFRLGPAELLIIAILVLFLFGGKRLPEMGKGLGEGIKNFKKAFKSDEEKEEKHA